MRNQFSSFQHHLGIDTCPGLLNEQHDERAIDRALALRNGSKKFRPHNMINVQGLASVCFLLMLAEEKHIHEIGVDHIQIPDAREEGLSKDTMKDVQVGRQLIGFLLSHRVNLQSAVGLEGLLVTGVDIAVRAKADRSLKPMIFHIK